MLGAVGREADKSTERGEGPPVRETAVLTSRDQLFERQEHHAAAERMRMILPLAIVLWLGFFAVDVVVATWVVPGPLAPYIVVRLAVVIPIALSTAFIRRQQVPSFHALRVLDLVMVSSCSAGLTGICIISGGLVSPFNAYIPLVLIGRAAVLPEHWKEGALRLGIPAALSPLLLAAAALVDERIAAQFADPGARGTFFFYIMMHFGAWLLLVIGGHNVWALRRQVFRSRSIGRYRLEERIGEGGMGEVWLAYHDQLKRKVALKILRPDRGTDPQAVGRFEREVMATAALNHPNTIRIYEHGVTPDGLWFYAMELLDGRALGTIVDDEGPLPPSRAHHLMLQTSRAMAEAHREGIVHRDLKPDNLFVTDLGGEADFIKVLDFGIAKLRAEDSANLTGTGFVAGTPAFISPEVASGLVADARSDVYGLGAAFYYALTGTLPFMADNAQAMFLKHLEAPLEPPSKRAGIPMPAAFEAAIVRCMAKSPDDRFADASELVEALVACAPRPTEVNPGPPRPAPPKNPVASAPESEDDAANRLTASYSER